MLPLSNKAKEIDERIALLKKQIEEQPYKQKKNSSLALVGNVVLELFAGIIVGGSIGYFLDKLFNTIFVFMLIFTLLGLVAGILNLYRKLKDL